MIASEACPRFSVVVVSRGRPDHLRRALRAIRQLDYPAFEIVVVGDDQAVTVAREGPAQGVKVVACDQANISVARNMGVSEAAGEFCAFIDDDAVPEPMWLQHHSQGLRQTGAVASVGYVRGPDGIGFQSRFETIGSDGGSSEARPPDTRPFVPRDTGGRAVKLIGTNMVIRRDVLAELGGFDPAFRYYLDDGDLSFRLAAARRTAAVVPTAEVHHALAPSARRTARRTMRTLFDIGRSKAVFLRRHGDDDPVRAFPGFAEGQRRRLLSRMVQGLMEPRDVACLMATLRDGWADGMRSELGEIGAMTASAGEFRPVDAVPPGHEVFACRRIGQARALAAARRAVEIGCGRASVFCLALTGVPHSVRYTDDGIWLQTGGQFVPCDTTKWRFRWCRFAERLDVEKRRVANQRGLKESDSVARRVGPGGRVLCE